MIINEKKPDNGAVLCKHYDVDQESVDRTREALARNTERIEALEAADKSKRVPDHRLSDYDNARAILVSALNPSKDIPLKNMVAYILVENSGTREVLEEYSRTVSELKRKNHELTQSLSESKQAGHKADRRIKDLKFTEKHQGDFIESLRELVEGFIDV